MPVMAHSWHGNLKAQTLGCLRCRRAFRRAEAEMQSAPEADSHRDSGNDDSGLDDEEALLSSRVLVSLNHHWL